MSKSNLSHSGDYRGRPNDCLSLGISVLNSWRQVMINHILTISLKVKQGNLETRKLQISLQPTNSLLLNQPVPWRLITEIFKSLPLFCFSSPTSNHTNKQKLALKTIRVSWSQAIHQTASHFKDPLKCFSTALLYRLCALVNTPQYLKLLFFLTLN